MRVQLTRSAGKQGSAVGKEKSFFDFRPISVVLSSLLRQFFIGVKRC